MTEIGADFETYLLPYSQVIAVVSTVNNCSIGSNHSYFDLASNSRQ